MTLWQAERIAEKRPIFASAWHIEARELLRVKADIERLRTMLVRYSSDCVDLPFRGKISSNKDIEQLRALRDEYREMASVADFPPAVTAGLVEEDVL